MSTIATLAPSLPTEGEAALAKETSRVLAARIQDAVPMELRILDHDAPEETLKLPAQAVRLLLRILEEMARGNAVTLVPLHAELTTQEAADMLNISRPTLIQLLDQKKINFRRIGTHRRIPFESLMAYKRTVREERQAAIDEFVSYNEELGI
ncbi:MAG TPA: helix-turn-helix domain-containing protein [Bryobacteraceae bacterium]|jgi:excisionase family DNA binding protein|nr:helix-turn-helix domain-containing protein [Bryobacteraceae bacterium]